MLWLAPRFYARLRGNAGLGSRVQCTPILFFVKTTEYCRSARPDLRSVTSKSKGQRTLRVWRNPRVPSQPPFSPRSNATIHSFSSRSMSRAQERYSKLIEDQKPKPLAFPELLSPEGNGLRRVGKLIEGQRQKPLALPRIIEAQGTAQS
jgi:hypothetical protein